MHFIKDTRLSKDIKLRVNFTVPSSRTGFLAKENMLKSYVSDHLAFYLC